MSNISVLNWKIAVSALDDAISALDEAANHLRILRIGFKGLHECVGYAIEYKATYNDGLGIPEPKWGPLMSKTSPRFPLRCPTCGSYTMYASASPADPEEIFLCETVRCGDCGHITDWYGAYKQHKYHYPSHFYVVGKPDDDNH